MSDTNYQRVGREGFGKTVPRDDQGKPLSFAFKIDLSAEPIEPPRTYSQNAPQFGPKFGTLNNNK